MSVLSVHATLKKGAFALDARFDAPLDGIVAVFGPSGAGKTLLLRTIAGLERPVGGRIAMRDRVLDAGPDVHVPAHARGIGLVFQDARLFPHLNVHDNLAFAVRRAPPGAAALSLAEAAEMFQIGALLDRSVRHLSGGERSRVALTRALLGAPDLLLLDEPFASLDGARRHAFLDELDALHRRLGLPMLVVTHQIEDAARIATHILGMKDGAVIANGSLGDTCPTEAFQSLLARREAGVALPLARLHGSAPATSGAAWVRADAVLLAIKAPEGLSARNVWEGRVASVRAEPASVVVQVKTGIGAVLSRITREAATELGIAPGARVWAILKTNAL